MAVHRLIAVVAAAALPGVASATATLDHRFSSNDAFPLIVDEGGGGTGGPAYAGASPQPGESGQGMAAYVHPGFSPDESNATASAAAAQSQSAGGSGFQLNGAVVTGGSEFDRFTFSGETANDGTSGSGATAFADSSADHLLFFHLDEPHDFRVLTAANPVSASHGPDGTAYARAFARLWSGSTYDPADGSYSTGTLVAGQAVELNGTDAANPVFDFDGVLPAGNYRFEAGVASGGNTEGDPFSAQASLSSGELLLVPVPEPAALGLLAIASAALLLRRNRLRA